MQVTVKFLGGLRDQMGTPALRVDLPDDGTYRDLLDAIGPEVQAKLAEWAWDAGRRSFSRRMMISRNSSVELRDEATVLAEGDEILVLLPLAGG